MKTFKCDKGKMVLLDNSSGDFIYKSDLLLYLGRERRFLEKQIETQKKQDCTSGWNKEYLELLKDRLSIYENIITEINK